jgi:3',5'-cyclic AMP phosphodiesterase CpdA
MICKGKRLFQVGILWLVAAILAAALSTGSGHCETLRFAFMADGRGDSLDEIINTTVLEAINSQILALSPRPSFLVYGGDSVYRGHTGRGYTFRKFKDAMKPLTDAGIKLYAVMGNHELYREGTAGFVLANQQEFQKEFTDNPANGPSGYERLVYSFESPGGDAFFAIGDCYYITKDEPSNDLHGRFDDTQLNWLTDKLRETKASHKFLFAHAPYYQIMGSQSAQNTTFTKFWRILDQYRVALFGCGHTHLYSRKTINSNIAPEPQLNPPVQWNSNVTQLLTGTCGAPVSTGAPTVDRNAWHVLNNDNTYYFSVIDINKKRVTVTSYGGQAPPYHVIDYFVISPNITPINSLLLLE